MAGFLLDTCVLSETRKRRPDAGVAQFLAEADAAQLYLSVLTIGEMRKGIAKKRLTDADAADQIAAWAHRIETDFADRILEVDVAVARLWGELSAGGRTPVIDTLIAATELVHGHTVVTRNSKDFVASH
ncbi:MAG: type II toxin-antitoxin system VapC family toxin [Rhodomicrobium sp.]|nr:type II toxin-antitoxin system VapC family toxin [Rhodomicrobium sp.]